jgi:hypothetical protein
MLAKLVEFLFGCWHRNYGFPMTLKRGRRRGAAASETYVVCLDCGRELPYDWNQMRVAAGRATRPLGAPENHRGQPSALDRLARSLANAR